MAQLIVKALLVGVLLAIAETFQGIFRIQLLNRRIGDRRARRVGVACGSAIIFVVGWFAVPWIGVSSPRESLFVGTIWLTLMLGYDIALGRLFFHLSWRRILADFDLRQGNFLGIGMAALLLTPLAVAWLRGLW